jgi:hypothetical protein
MMHGLTLDDILKSVEAGAEGGDILAGIDVADRVRKAKAKQALDAEARLRLAQAVLNVFNSPDGQVLFDYLVAKHIRHFFDVSALSLPMETAIQLYAEQNGQKALVHDLLRLVKEGQTPQQPAQA